MNVVRPIPVLPLDPCPQCDRPRALVPEGGWARWCLGLLLSPERRYRCRFCGHVVKTLKLPPWVKH